MPLESNSGTTFERCGTIPPEYATSWTTALPYFQTVRSIVPFAKLPEDDTHLTDEVFKIIHHLSSCPNAEAQSWADGGDAEAAIDYGLR
jgi:hypothetical protein